MTLPWSHSELPRQTLAIERVMGVPMLLLSVFERLEQENIQYCLLRDYDQLDQLVNGGEVDLLVRDDQLGQMRSLLVQLGFVGLPNWGHAPHHFFVAYDQPRDCWLKLDVVTEVAYGKPIHALRTTLAAGCLGNRQRCGPVFVPSPEDELITLLLHCLLDKGRFAPARRQRLRELRHQVADERYLSTLLAQSWGPSMTWPRLAALVDSENWGALLDESKIVVEHLASRDRLGTLIRQVRGRVLRKLNRRLQARRPRSPMIALLAPDGAGKSTLAATIQESFYFPVRWIYMGLYQKGSTNSAFFRLPGLSLTKRLFTQWWRYLNQAQGRLVIFDRYTYDALLPPRQNLSRFRRWRRRLLAHACPAPDLVLLLDAPGDVLFARKGEHNGTVLEEQRQSYLSMQEGLPQMVVIDAARNAEQVRREAISLIWRSYVKTDEDRDELVTAQIPDFGGAE
jgi:thymidylate kinase